MGWERKMQRIIDSRMRNLLLMAFARPPYLRLTRRLAFTATRRLLGAGWVAVATLLPLSLEASGLTIQQTDQAYQISTQALWPQARALATPHPLGLQTLSIEKQERKNHLKPRWVNVYQYHYSQQASRVLLIDLAANTVLRKTSIDTVHLPLNDIEIEFARTLLSQNTELMNRLRQAQIRQGKPAFESLTELDIKASIYEPMNTTDACHKQRCALVSLFDETRTVLSLEPIINLTTFHVNTLESK